MSKLFISYRRDDSADVTGRIYDRLISRFDRDSIFKDVDSIPLGVDFSTHLSNAVGRCQVVLAVIGRQWLTTVDKAGKRRLDDPTDPVRLELEAALQRDIHVIPLLVQGVSMPQPKDLPSVLQKLSFRNGIPVRPDPDFHKDMDRLIENLTRLLQGGESHSAVWSVLNPLSWIKGKEKTTAIEAERPQVTKKTKTPQKAAIHVKQGKLCYQNGDFNGAISEHTRALSVDSENVEAYRSRGLAYSKKGDHDSAIADYDQALRLEPDHAETYNYRGTAYWTKGAAEQAIADFSAAIRLNRNYALAFRNRGSAYRKKDAYDLAIADYSEALRLQPEHVETHRNRGLAQSKKGDHDAAIADYNEALRLQPDHADTYRNRGLAHNKKANHDAAIADYNEALRLQPDHPETYNYRGTAYLNKGAVDQALIDFGTAIRLNGKYIMAHRNRGVAHLKKNDYDSAVADWKEAILADPTSPACYNSLAWLWATSLNVEWRNGSKAVEYARRACELSKWEKAYIIDTLAAAYAENGQFAEAIQWSKKALDLAADDKKADYRSRLELYEAGTPCHVPTFQVDSEKEGNVEEDKSIRGPQT